MGHNTSKLPKKHNENDHDFFLSLQLFAVLTEVNAILDDKWMGGGNIGGHGLTLAMHLLREKKSFHKFIACLTTDFNTLNDGINCLLPFHQALATVSTSTARDTLTGTCTCTLYIILQKTKLIHVVLV